MQKVKMLFSLIYLVMAPFKLVFMKLTSMFISAPKIKKPTPAKWVKKEVYLHGEIYLQKKLVPEEV